MASAGDEEPPPTAGAAPSSVATGNATAPGDAGNLNSPAPISNTASASATASSSPTADADASDLPPLIVSDIAPPATAVSLPPRPAGPPITAPTSVASPAPRTASPSVHGLGASRPGRTSMSGTPHQSPALPSPPVPLRASPAASRPPPAAINTTTTTTRGTKYQNNPVWRAEPPREYKPKIPPVPIPSPAPSTPSLAAARAVSFPSPGREHVHSDQKFLDDKTRITFGIQQAIPEAVRRSVRDNWEKCLLGSDFHQAFILNASIHHATPAAVQRGIRDFGSAMIASARTQIIDAMDPDDIDAVASHILSKASESFLDAALELRLKSIDAKRLINALARAERLGYEPSDVVDEDDDPAASQPPADYYEQVLPAPAPQPPREKPAPPQQRSQPARQPVPQPPPQPGINAPSAPLMYCNMCFRKFVYRSAYEHHVSKKICTRSPAAPGGYKFSCQHCGQGFTTIMGVQYHNANNICGKNNEEQPLGANPAPAAVMPATPKATKPTPKTPASAPTPTPAVMHTPMSTPGSAQSGAKPSSSGGPRMGTPGLHTPNGAVADPYAHLSPEQLAAMQDELRQAELSYGERFRQANAIQNDAERKTKLDGLSNSFGTKQSLIRKKYGVRLRMRRTKAEIQAERDRMQYKTAAELAADNGVPSAPLGRPGRPPASTPSRPLPVYVRVGPGPGGVGSTYEPERQARARAEALGRQASMNTPTSASPVPASSAGGPGVGSKRRLSGASQSSESKRVAYSEMGGLSGGTAAHEETMDPTLPPLVAGARKASTVSAKGLGTAAEPMALDDDSDSGSEDSDDNDDEDIPAELPPSVRQSLQRASPSVTPGPRSGDGK